MPSRIRIPSLKNSVFAFVLVAGAFSLWTGRAFADDNDTKTVITGRTLPLNQARALFSASLKDGIDLLDKEGIRVATFDPRTKELTPLRGTILEQEKDGILEFLGGLKTAYFAASIHKRLGVKGFTTPLVIINLSLRPNAGTLVHEWAHIQLLNDKTAPHPALAKMDLTEIGPQFEAAKKKITEAIRNGEVPSVKITKSDIQKRYDTYESFVHFTYLDTLFAHLTLLDEMDVHLTLLREKLVDPKAKDCEAIAFHLVKRFERLQENRFMFMQKMKDLGKDVPAELLPYIDAFFWLEAQTKALSEELTEKAKTPLSPSEFAAWQNSEQTRRMTLLKRQ